MVSAGDGIMHKVVGFSLRDCSCLSYIWDLLSIEIPSDKICNVHSAPDVHFAMQMLGDDEMMRGTN